MGTLRKLVDAIGPSGGLDGAAPAKPRRR
jgi:hypothetical protein